MKKLIPIGKWYTPIYLLLLFVVVLVPTITATYDKTGSIYGLIMLTPALIYSWYNALTD